MTSQELPLRKDAACFHTSCTLSNYQGFEGISSHCSGPTFSSPQVEYWRKMRYSIIDLTGFAWLLASILNSRVSMVLICIFGVKFAVLPDDFVVSFRLRQ